MSSNDEKTDDAPWEAAPEMAPNDWEFAAAAIELALLGSAGGSLLPLPHELAKRISRDAPAHLPRISSTQPKPAVQRLDRGTAGRSRLSMAGWWTASCLAGVLLWQWSAAQRITAPPLGGGAPPTLADRREKLLANDPEAVTVAWNKPGDDPAIHSGTGDQKTAGGLGDVVWSQATQKGFMRFRGLEANDPNVSQYQLWIFDAQRDEAYPVDGGVFDVPAQSDGDIVVQIDPRLPVSRATAFAVTVEKPGGVVVSSRKRLPLLAAVPSR